MYLPFFFCSSLAQKSPIQVRSHGTAIKPSEKTDQSTDFESVLGLDIIPRNRLRVIRRNQPGNQPDDAETLEAAKAAGLVAKQIQNSIKKSPRLDYQELEKFDTFSPVSFLHLFSIRYQYLHLLIWGLRSQEKFINILRVCIYQFHGKLLSVKFFVSENKSDIMKKIYVMLGK